MVKWSAPARNDLKQIHAYISPYRLVYEISADRIVILAVIHGRRDFNPAWDEREP
jgi:plasmid stabilization system protein ParE